MAGDRVVVSPLYTTNERLPLTDRRLQQVSVEQLLYAARAEIAEIEPDTYGNHFVEIVMRESPAQIDGYLFPSAFAHPFEDGEVLTLDPDPNDGFGQQLSAVVRDVRSTLDGSKAGHHTLYHWLFRLQGGQEWDEQEGKARAELWPNSARQAQSMYFAGLREAHRLGVSLEEYDDEDATFIGALGTDTSRFIIAHGPPGTGKSLRASHAVFARLQGALADGQQLRVLISAPTHAATDALLRKVWSTQRTLARLLELAPALRHYFDQRLLGIPLFRVAPHGDVPHGVAVLPKSKNKGNRDDIANADRILEHRYTIVAGTPGGIYGVYKSDRWLRQRFHAKRNADLLILDEAARMSIPEALMASIPLAPTGQILLCGDNMQFSPIHALDWEKGNPPRIPLIYGAYKSIFDFLCQCHQVPQVRFTRTHRCHVKPVCWRNWNRRQYARCGIRHQRFVLHRERFRLHCFCGWFRALAGTS